MSGVQTRTIGDDENGMRLDRWFKKHFPDLSHGKLEKLLRTGQVRLEGKRAKSNARIETGQSVRVPPLDTDEGAKPKLKPKAKTVDISKEDADALRARVLYRDDWIIALDKPAGLPTQGGTKVKRSLDDMLDVLRFGSEERPRLVHRLDKDTSGVLLLGRTAEATRKLTAAFRSRDTQKIYWTVVVGVPREKEGRIKLALSKLPGQAGERMVADPENGKSAVTDFSILDSAAKKAAWLAMAPRTGRTHQLRVHAAEIGHPIVGDGKYGGQDAFIGGGNLSANLHLHARAIRLPHPKGQGIVEVIAPLPDHMKKTWAFLGFDESDGADPFEPFIDAEY